MSRRNLAWLLGVTAVALLSLTVFFRVPTHAQNEDYDDVTLVVDVLHKVRQSYVTDLDRKRRRKLVEDMVNGGLERLDPHSQYINAQDLKQFNKQSKGKFGGVGIQVGYDRQKGEHVVRHQRRWPARPASRGRRPRGRHHPRQSTASRPKTMRHERGHRPDPGRAGPANYRLQTSSARRREGDR